MMTLGVCKYSQIVLALAQHNNQIIFTLFSVLILNLDLYSIHADTHLMPSKNVSPNAEFLLLFYLYMYIHIPTFYTVLNCFRWIMLLVYLFLLVNPLLANQCSRVIDTITTGAFGRYNIYI